MELDARSPATRPNRLRAAITYVCSVAHVARLLGEDAELLEAIFSNEDNMTYGNIVSVHIGHEDYVATLTPTLGVRQQPRLSRDQALYLAGCKARHESLELHF